MLFTLLWDNFYEKESTIPCGGGGGGGSGAPVFYRQLFASNQMIIVLF